jgi:hypothetical protein
MTPKPMSWTSPLASGMITGNEPAQALVEQLDGDRADEGAPHRAEAAEDDHEQDLDRQLEVRHRRVDDRQPVRVKHTGQTGIPADRTNTRSRRAKVSTPRHSAATSESLTALRARPVRLCTRLTGQPQPDDDDGVSSRKYSCDVS